MQSRFGFKDLIQLVLSLTLIVLVVLSMQQSDRRWEQTLAQMDQQVDVSNQLSAIQRGLQQGMGGTSNDQLIAAIGQLAGEVAALRASVRQAGQNGGLSLAPDGANPGAAAEPSFDLAALGRDTSWARPGVPIEWQPEFAHTTDPRDRDGFRPGGEFVEMFASSPAKLTPFIAGDVYARNVTDLTHQTLAAYDDVTLAFEGVLAEAWQPDPAGEWVRVKIRDEAVFSDGQPVTAEDVRYTIEDYILNPEVNAARARSLLEPLYGSIEVLGDKALEIRFKKPAAYNLQAVLGSYVLPRHRYERFTAEQLNESTGLLVGGSGPYQLSRAGGEWKPGDDVVLEPNPQYWGPPPALSSYRFRTVNTDAARLVEFRNTNASILVPTPQQFAELRTEPKFAEGTQLLQWKNIKTGYFFIAWQTGPRGGPGGELTPFADKRVRRAMTLALDRWALIRDVFEGIGSVAVGPNNPPSPAANPEIEPWPYDPGAAAALLAEAGWADRDGDNILENEAGDEFEFEYTIVSGSETYLRLATAVQESMTAIGVRCTIRPLEWASYVQTLDDRDFDAITLGWSASAPESDPTQIWHPQSIDGQGDNFVQWDAGQGPLIDRIVAELDFGTRMGLFHELHALIHDEQPYTFLRASESIGFVHDEFGNVNQYPGGLNRSEFFMAVPTVEF